VDELTEDTIRGALAGRFGDPLRVFDSVGSTNTVALEWAAEGVSEGAVVATDHQTEGRGRWGRTWASKPGALLQFSLILRPALSLDRLGLLTVALGVAVADGIERTTGLPTSIKWPNDVLLSERKVAGILVETRVTGTRLDAAIAGIGVNVNWRREDMPEEVAARATSISAELGSSPPRARLLAALLEAIEDSYGLLAERYEEIIDRAAERSVVLGRHVVVRYSDGHTKEGMARRFLPNGALEIESDGALQTIEIAEVEQVRPA
jgi:BirA family biotin operon repressor/biotin-[acetyl-CoA-carboxylase] ligase